MYIAQKIITLIVEIIKPTSAALRGLPNAPINDNKPPNREMKIPTILITGMILGIKPIIEIIKPVMPITFFFGFSLEFSIMIF